MQDDEAMTCQRCRKWCGDEGINVHVCAPPREGEPGHEQSLADDLAELERLRSDGWLEAAAREIAIPEIAASTTIPIDFEAEIERTVREDYMPVLRKHRDGRG